MYLHFLLWCTKAKLDTYRVLYLKLSMVILELDVINVQRITGMYYSFHSLSIFLAICAILGADIAAVKLDKNMPKENSARKSVVQLGKEELKTEPPQETKESAKEKKTAPKPKVNPPAPSPPVTNSRSKRPSRSSESSTVAPLTASKPNSSAKEKKSQILYCLCREPERPGLKQFLILLK